jgi:hypothetical protein
MAVEVAALLFSWIGLRLNRAEMAQRTATYWFISNLRFKSPRFWQFCLEVVITGLYFVIGLTLALPLKSTSSVPRLPSERWVLGLLMAIWFTYVVWDQLDAHIAETHDDDDWKHKADIGRNVSIIFFFLFGGIFAIQWVWQATDDHSILAWNLVALVVLYLCRTTQQWAKTRWDPTPTAVKTLGG